jgi:hypothetical protein
VQNKVPVKKNLEDIKFSHYSESAVISIQNAVPNQAILNPFLSEFGSETVTSVVDPKLFITDPDPTFQRVPDLDPDPTCKKFRLRNRPFS